MSQRLLLFLSGLTLVIFLTTCGDPGPVSDTTSPADTTTAIDSTPALSRPDCTIQGEVLEDNMAWNSTLDVLTVIKADSSTASEGFGLSHRILEVLDGRTCQSKFRTVLDENVSPDFPYYLADIQYNHSSNLVGIQGYYDLYILDLSDNYQLTKLTPDFFTERLFDDPQSGMITRLEVWENFLLGYAQDSGPFAFDLRDKANPTPTLPFAEWQSDETGQYHSLFLLPSENGGTQALMPYYDAETEAFVITPLFDEPVSISTNVQRNARNNRFLVLRGENDASRFYAIDLGERALMNPPASTVEQGTQAILNWMRAQAG